MADDPVSALQKGVRARLRSVSELMVLVNAVYDQPPDSAAVPYIRFGETDLLPDHTDTTREYSVMFRIETHTRPEGGGKVEAQRINGAVIDALDRLEAEVIIEGFDLCDIKFLTGNVSRQRDGKTHIGVTVFEADIDAGDF